MSGHLAEVLARETREGDLYDTLPDGRLRCYRVRALLSVAGRAIRRLQGALQPGRPPAGAVGYVGGVQCDPIEKKAVLSRAPGALAYSFGMLGAISTARIVRTG
jgi:hypothetical protein